VNLDLNVAPVKNMHFKVDLHGDGVKTIGGKILSRRSSLVITKAEDGHSHGPKTEDDVDSVLKVRRSIRIRI